MESSLAKLVLLQRARAAATLTPVNKDTIRIGGSGILGTDYTVELLGTKTIYTFLNPTKAYTFITPRARTIEYFALGGGAAGGWYAGGGGGAGGLQRAINFTLPAGSHAVTIGAGGVTESESGGITSLGSWVTAVGGGGGGGASNDDTTASTGRNGGCGGGGTYTNLGGAKPGGTGSQGFAGGNAVGTDAGGGGGVGGAGFAGNAGREGGTGVTYYGKQYGGGGGGGTATDTSTATTNTSFGGGRGGGKSSSASVYNATSGASNTGAGGGGGGVIIPSGAAGTWGAGGSGILIVTIDAFAGVFQPTMLPSVALWLDAADRTAMLPATGTTITTWKDKSGNARDLSQASESSKPTLVNGKLAFNGSQVLGNST